MGKDMLDLEAARAEVAKAANRDKADVSVSGKLELPEIDGLVVVRFNSDAYVQFSLDSVVPNSITAFSRKELQAISKNSEESVLGLKDWFHLKLRHGASCILYFKTVKVELVLDRLVQEPFYIDTNSLSCVYLTKRAADLDISCDDDFPDRTNAEVIIYTNRACCCNNNHVTAYGYVSCDDGWRIDDCL